VNPLRVPIDAPGERLRELLLPLLDRGGVLAIPTESSYGLAADPWNPEGIARIYALKGRDAARALPVVAADRAQVAALGVDLDRPDLALLARAWDLLWPGPVTVVLPVVGALPAAAPDATVAVRIPAHEGLRRLLAELGRPLTATSANRSGEPPVVEPAAAARLLAGTDGAVVDGGRLAGGAPSTVIRLAGGRVEVLREGAVERGQLLRLLGERSF
jgi:L-threonylcarbamoyladenylate synthase